MIVYKQGDVFKGGEDVIVHGCNCICNMGAGLAGGNWNRIEEIINKKFYDREVVVYEY